MVNTWSGSIVYEWIQETNNYGLIKFAEPFTQTAAGAPSGVEDGFVRTGTPTPINPDFENLSRHWASLSPTGVKADEYQPSHTPPPCPAFTKGAWEVDPEKPLPTLASGGGGSATLSDKPTATGSQDTMSAEASATGKVNAGAGNQGGGEGTSGIQGSEAATSSSAAALTNTNGASALSVLWVVACAAICAMVGAALV